MSDIDEAPISVVQSDRENDHESTNGSQDIDNSSPGSHIFHGFDTTAESEQPPEHHQQDEEIRKQETVVANTKPTTELELALTAVLARKDALIERITGEITKLKSFVQKRKQTYKRKRKEDGAPTRALSAYNLFIKERFEQLAKENEKALTSDDADAELKRVPPSNLVTKTGNEWKELPPEIKAQYEERAKADRKRYEEEMAEYQPPDKNSNRKRNKTGYNMFFSAHVLRLKTTESGVPSERGSVARVVGNAWKSLSSEDKQYYEREADRYNGMSSSSTVKEDDEVDEEEELKLAQQMMVDHPYPYPPHGHGGGELLHPHHHHHAAAAAAAAAIHGQPPLHPSQVVPPSNTAAVDPRVANHHHSQSYYPPAHLYAAQNPYGHYDYSQHHQRHPPPGRQQMYQYAPHHHGGGGGRNYDPSVV